uniref:Wsv133-like protein n=1 Tax=Marsupenaeus japonicus endogenous nimavirus TaxID=2133793 RepID=A0A401IP79_9VIRU|nr:MAG: wsv133-like protein [Marsupenaeus japonicus endogenous nimavirus]GBG35417.1 wsv133-like protein [Marsupenaeus japonicus endogenous nimavirus]
MAANNEYMYLLESIKRDLISPDILNDNFDNTLEKELLTELAEEAAFVGFFSEIGLCTSNNLFAINSRLQKQSKTTISLQLGSHISAEFQTLKSDILIDDHYKVLLPSNELDRKMQSNRKHVSHSKGRIVEPLWNYMVEFKKQRTNLHTFSVTANPFEYEKDVKINPKSNNTGKDEDEDECQEECNDNDDDEEEMEAEEEEDDDGVITIGDGNFDREGKYNKSKKYNKNITTSSSTLPCHDCQCVARIIRKLDGNDNDQNDYEK